MKEFDWNDAASRLVKAEIAREGLTLASLAARLQRLGLQETESSVKSKLHRGTFSATFLMQCLVALDREEVGVSSVLPKDMPRGSALTPKKDAELP